MTATQPLAFLPWEPSGCCAEPFLAGWFTLPDDIVLQKSTLLVLCLLPWSFSDLCFVGPQGRALSVLPHPEVKGVNTPGTAHSPYGLNAVGYSWSLNHMGLKCTGPLIRGYFSIINTTVLQDARLVESRMQNLEDMEEPWIQKADCKVVCKFSTV